MEQIKQNLQLEKTYQILEHLNKKNSKFRIGFTTFDILIYNKYNKLLFRIKEINKSENNNNQENKLIIIEEYRDKLLNIEILEIYELIIETIKENNIEINFNQNLISKLYNLKKQIKNPYLNMNEREIERCEQTEYFFFELLNNKSKYFKRGILIYLNEELIGIRKSKGTRSMLSLKLNENNLPLEKMGIYILPEYYQLDLISYDELEQRKEKSIIDKITHKTDWIRINFISKQFGQLNLTHKISNTQHFLATEFIDTAFLKSNNRHHKKKMRLKQNETKQGIKKYIIEQMLKVYNKNKDRKNFDKTINLETYSENKTI